MLKIYIILYPSERIVFQNINTTQDYIPTHNKRLLIYPNSQLYHAYKKYAISYAYDLYEYGGNEDINTLNIAK